MLEKRAAVLELMTDAFDARRPFIRVGLDHPGLHAVALVGATYGLPTRTLGTIGLLGPVRMDYARRCAPCARPLVRALAAGRSHVRRGLTAALGLLAWPRLNGTTTSCSASRAARATPRSRRRSGSSRASCTRTSPRSRTRRSASGPSPRRTRCSRRPRRASSTTATATRGCAAAATRRPTSTSRT